MHQADNDEVKDRIDRLERALRRQRWVMMAMAMVIVGVFVGGQSAGGILSVVRTKKLMVYNDKNEPVFLVGTDKESGKGTWQLIQDNKAIVSCFPGKWGGSIAMSKGGEAKTGLLLVGDRDGYGSVIVWDDNHAPKWESK
ncbi:MAG: hypothetical protein GC159_20155 [Phycisphaera sp.]|nr:hypothetical protein [Phycisphaera sp.]